jgi:putative ATP-dependent endonuclease of OLD family
MQLNWLRFENYRGLPDFELEVQDNLVLVGPNDSGKSSLLLGLHMLLGTRGNQLATSLMPLDFTDAAQTIVIEARLIDFTDEERAAFPDEISIIDGKEHLRIRLEASISDVEPDVVLIERSFPDSGLSRRLSGEQLRAIGWEYVPATRSLYRELGGSRSGVMRSLLSGVALGDAEAAVKEALRQLAASLDASDALGTFKEELADALSVALPREVDKESVRILLPGELSEDPLADAQIGLASNTGLRTLNEQSDGIRALAAIAAYGLAHFGANMIAIDEPEMHLHPTAQKLVARILRSGAAQALLATHSSHVAAHFSPKEIAVLRPGTGVSQLDQAAPAGDLYFAARWWQDEFVQPLTANCLAVVEGPSERMLLDAVAENLNLNLHRRGVHIFDLGGAGQFKNAIAAFGTAGFGIRVVGLVDEDHRTQWAKVLEIEANELEQRGYRVCDPDLEGVAANTLGAERVIEMLEASGLFREKRILATLGAATRADATDDDVADYLRCHKTEAAAALSRAMTSKDASKLVPLVEMLNESLQ